MSRRIVIGALLGIVVVAIVLAVSFSGTQTGRVTLTQGAHYGPIDPGFNVYTKCRYLSADDGWDVTVRNKVETFDKTRGVTFEREDLCETRTRVSEVHCDEGYMKERVAVCPSGTSCKDGACS